MLKEIFLNILMHASLQQKFCLPCFPTRLGGGGDTKCFLSQIRAMILLISKVIGSGRSNISSFQASL